MSKNKKTKQPCYSEVIDLTESDNITICINDENNDCFSNEVIALENRHHSSTSIKNTTGRQKQQSKESESSTLALSNYNLQSLAEQERNDFAIAQALSKIENAKVPSKKPRLIPSSSATRKRLLKSFKCIICLEEDVKNFQGYSISACSHRFCIECLANLIKSNPPSLITNTETNNQIKCPAMKCEQYLSLFDIQYIFRDEPESWKEYSNNASTASIERQVSNDVGGMRRCPSERCNYIFVHDHEHHFDCPLCNSSFCLYCFANSGSVGPAHPGQSCVERYEQLQKEEEERVKMEQWREENAKSDARFKALIESERNRGMTRQCPSCKRLITKNGGCDHMQCICGLSYNWSQSK